MRRNSVFALAIFAALGVGGCGGSSSLSVPGTPHSSGTVRRLHTLAVTKLASYNVDLTKTTVAGISSGGFMAVQLHVAYSGTFHFAAIYAGGPYYCAGDSLTTAEVDCQDAIASELSPSESYLDSQSSAGTIDPESNLSGQKAYLWSGTSDETVNQKTMNDLNTEYQHYGVATKYDNTYAAGHGWESPYGEVACGTTASPYMIDCSNYDSEQTWMTYFYGTLNAKNTGTPTGTLINFDQTPYGGGANDLDTNGYLYVPTTCAQGTQCKLIVALDGCEQTQASIGTKFITEAGLEQWADTNAMLLLFPYQVSSSTPSNPNGCWDWWGYETSNYALKAGPQMSAIVAMVKQIAAGSSATPSPAPTAAPTATPSPGPTATASAGATPTPASTLAPTPTPAPTRTPSPTPSPTPAPTPAPSPAPPYSQVVTTTVVLQYDAGRLTLSGYLQMGMEYGYDSEITLYDCAGTWTNSPTCGPLH